MFLSFRTIQNHRTRIMRKLNLKKNTDLVKYAIQMGLYPRRRVLKRGAGSWRNFNATICNISKKMS